MTKITQSDIDNDFTLNDPVFSEKSAGWLYSVLDRKTGKTHNGVIRKPFEAKPGSLRASMLKQLIGKERGKVMPKRGAKEDQPPKSKKITPPNLKEAKENRIKKEKDRADKLEKEAKERADELEKADKKNGGENADTEDKPG